MSEIVIRDVKTFVTAPRGINLVVVKVETSEPELYGYGCATFTWRHKAVVTAVEEYLKPLFVGKNVQNIQEIWQSMMGSSYWRNSAVLNNAMSGVDEALWDIKGKLAGMPVYDLLGENAEKELPCTGMPTEKTGKKSENVFMVMWKRDIDIFVVTWGSMVVTLTADRCW